MMKSRKMSRTGNVECVGRIRTTYIILAGEPERNVQLEIPWNGRDNSNKTDLTGIGCWGEGQGMWSGCNWFISGLFGFRKLEEFLADRRNCRTTRNATSYGSSSLQLVAIVWWDLKTRNQLQV
jgi:hypothetical protein